MSANANAKVRDKVQSILERHVGHMVVDLRRQFGAELQVVLRHLVAGGKLVYQGTSARVLEMEPAPLRERKKMPREQLRCKHGDGKECKNPSRGPRFHYRCKEHTLPPAQAKKTKRAMKAKRAAKRAAAR